MPAAIDTPARKIIIRVSQTRGADTAKQGASSTKKMPALWRCQGRQISGFVEMAVNQGL